ncbi:hypothetical protein [Shewanella sp. GXUN23E]|uniref:hypothetical protein n=1 Tax=Shewanella sp. GXUN23E TaxID=3422498 RepID=UPI003D7E40DF
MDLLQSMTGADSATKLVLLAWCASFGCDWILGRRKVIAEELGVSQRQLIVALEYLEKEGYFWKIKSAVKYKKGEKDRPQFEYSLSPESWLLWQNFRAEICWADEFEYALVAAHHSPSKGQGKTAPLTWAMRLVWAALLKCSNQAGYAVGVDSQRFAQHLNLSDTQLRRATKGLVSRGIVYVTSGLPPTVVTPRLGAIYRIYPQCSDQKVINLGVNVDGHYLTPFRFFRELVAYHDKAAKTPERLPCARDAMSLSDEQYFELAEIFCSNKRRLAIYIHHLGLTVIWELLSEFGALKKDGSLSTAGDGQIEFPLEEIQSLVQFKLCKVLSMELETSVGDGDVDTEKGTDGDQFLKGFFIYKLVEEVVWKLWELSRQWREFIDLFGSNIQLVGHLPAQVMVATVGCSDALETDNDSKAKGERTMVSTCVLQVSVPNAEQYADTMVFSGEVFSLAKEPIDKRVKSAIKIITDKP